MTEQNDEENIGKSMGKIMIFVTWAILLGFLTLFFSQILHQQRNPNQDVQSMQLSSGIKQVVLQRNRQGHYVATGQINGQAMEFLLDTGASDIAIPKHLAEQLGLRALGPILYQTANGVVTGYRTKLKSVRLGNIELTQVNGGINPGMRNNQILLGMSFLKHLEFTQRGDTLTLRQY
ncbi:MAG: TIGR02281 family clan AA aspartic protease [Gammaproteobacteria bacterium]|nr:TIGR02281 family clan AA aspartic protease [Gammaproteobacteria bacterium]